MFRTLIGIGMQDMPTLSMLFRGERVNFFSITNLILNISDCRGTSKVHQVFISGRPSRVFSAEERAAVHLQALLYSLLIGESVVF